MRASASSWTSVLGLSVFLFFICILLLVGLAYSLPEGCVFIALGFEFAVWVQSGLFIVWERDPILRVFGLLEVV